MKDIYPPLEQFSEQELDALIQEIQREKQDRVKCELMTTADNIVKELKTLSKHRTHIQVEAMIDGYCEYIDILISDLITAFERAGDNLS